MCVPPLLFVLPYHRVLGMHVFLFRMDLASKLTIHAPLLPLQDIYIARAQNELVLEEQLFRALINIYRCE